MQKSDEGFFSDASKEVNRLLRSGIEVVITRRTRNAFAVDSGTWVRIPPTPPYENRSLVQCTRLFIFAESGEGAVFYFVRQYEKAGFCYFLANTLGEMILYEWGRF